MRDRIEKALDTHIWWAILTFAVFLLFAVTSYGQNRNEVRQYLDSIDCKYSDIVTAQSVLETGHFKSYGCRERNNLFGLWHHKKQEFYTFDNWRDSCRAYLSMVQYKYKDGDYYVFLKELGYASDPEYINKLKSISSGSR
jgi:hypothetical protein